MGEHALDLARKGAGLLRERGFAQARLEAELLLAGVLGLERLQLYLQFDRPVSESELERYRGFVRRRLKHEPVQYTLGETAFRRLRLKVDPRVLIPRPETEVLVGEVLRWAGTRPGPLRALDLGTGSGAIALSLAAEGNFGAAVGTDCSADALAVARSNAAACGVADRVEWRLGALWNAVAEGERFDAVVSNPPYVARSEADSLPPEVRDWEPAGALFGGEDGLAVVRAIVAGARDRLVPGGLLALEIGATQGPAVVAMVEAGRGAWCAPRVIRDLAGRDRVVLAEAAQERGEMAELGDPIRERAQELGRAMGQTEEYKALVRARERIGEDREAVQRMNRLSELEREVSTALHAGEEPSLAVQEEYEQLFSVLQAAASYQALVAAQSNFDKILLRVNEEIGRGIESGARSRIIIPS